MSYTIKLPETMTKLRQHTDQPWHLGVAVGTMLYYISPLISTHLDNSVNFKNKSPSAVTSATGYVAAIDQYIAHLRRADGYLEKLPSDLDVNRKERRSRRRCLEHYTFLIEAAYKGHVRQVMADVFNAWSSEQTRLFNKGVDKALSGLQWVMYPPSNVVIEAGEGDWAAWIREQCEELGKGEIRAGRRALEEEMGESVAARFPSL